MQDIEASITSPVEAASNQKLCNLQRPWPSRKVLGPPQTCDNFPVLVV